MQTRYVASDSEQEDDEGVTDELGLTDELDIDPGDPSSQAGGTTVTVHPHVQIGNPRASPSGSAALATPSSAVDRGAAPDSPAQQSASKTAQEGTAQSPIAGPEPSASEPTPARSQSQSHAQPQAVSADPQATQQAPQPAASSQQSSQPAQPARSAQNTHPPPKPSHPTAPAAQPEQPPQPQPDKPATPAVPGPAGGPAQHVASSDHTQAEATGPNTGQGVSAGALVETQAGAVAQAASIAAQAASLARPTALEQSVELRNTVRDSTITTAQRVEKEVEARLRQDHEAALSQLKAQYEQQLTTQAQELAVALLKVQRLERAQTHPPPAPTTQAKGGKAAPPRESVTHITESHTESLTQSLTEEVTSLRQEVTEQDRLLQAYQHENKAASKRIKELESALKEATTVRPLTASTLGFTDPTHTTQPGNTQHGGPKSLTPREAAQRLTEVLALHAQLQDLRDTSSARESELKTQVDRLRLEKRDLEARLAGVDLGKQQEGDVLVKQVREEMESMKTQYQDAISKLQDKLKWYAENQELLTRQDRLVHEQQEVIAVLEKRLADAEGPTGRSASAQVSALQAQVAALQQSLRARGLPKSLAAVIEAAKPGPGESERVRDLQTQVATLEKKLTDKDEEYERQLRSYQQQYEKLRLQFEERQNALQAQLKGRKKESQLQQQLDEQRTMYTRQIKELKTKLQQAQAQGGASARHGGGASTSAAGGAAGSDPQVPASLLRAKESEVARLQQELQRKTRQVAEMHLKLGEAEAKVVQLGRTAGGLRTSLAPSGTSFRASPLPASSPAMSHTHRPMSQGGVGGGYGYDSPVPAQHQQPWRHAQQAAFDTGELLALQQRNDSLAAQVNTLQQQLFEAQQQIASHSAMDRSLAASDALSRAREQATLEDVARWKGRYDEATKEHQALKAKVAALEQDLDAAKQREKSYTAAPQALEFALLEQKLDSMAREVAAREARWQEVLEDTRQLYAMQAEIAQRKLEAGLASKNVEVEMLRQRVDDLLVSAARWQQHQTLIRSPG